MALNLSELFGVDSSEIFEEKETALGYLQGTENAAMVHEAITKAWAHKSRAFREGLLQALREQL